MFLLLAFFPEGPVRCCWIILARDRVILVSVSGVPSGTTSLSPGRSGAVISSGLLMWDLWSFRFPCRALGSGCVGVTKSESLSDTSRTLLLPETLIHHDVYFTLSDTYRTNRNYRYSRTGGGLLGLDNETAQKVNPIYKFILETMDSKIQLMLYIS